MTLKKNTKMHTLYLYSTSTTKRAIARVDGTKTWPPRAKAGQTLLNNAIVRVKQQDTTSTVEPLELLESINVPENITDHLVRNKICSYTGPTGVKYSKSRVDADREWIDFHGEVNETDMIRIWKEAINDIWYGIRKPNSFSTFEYQQEIIDRIVNRFQSGTPGSNDHLLSAIMRSGKCFMSYEVSRKMSFKQILVITGKTGVNEGWGELLPKGNDPHVNYSTWHYHNYNKIKKIGFIPKQGTNVVFVSLQYLNTHLDPSKGHKLLPQLVTDILATSWDLIIFDEQHWATQTKNTTSLLSTLKYKFKLELSGTAYKTLIQGRYLSENVTAFDYIDEQTRRKDGSTDERDALKYRPDINYALIHIDNKIKNMVDKDGDGFTMTKLFAVAKNSVTFKNTQSVNDFLHFVKENVYKNQYQGDMSKFAPYISNLNRHTLWILPDSIKGIKALEDLLEKHLYYSKYKVINASGNNIKNISDVTALINDVDAEKYEGKSGTITLTCGRFLEGTTVPKWWTVHQMNDDSSAPVYFQGSFRNKSENKNDDKQHVMVYDYNPERFIKVVYDANIDNVRKTTGKSTGDVIRTWCECSGVFDYDGNSWKLVSGAEIIERANNDIKHKMNMFNGVEVKRSVISSKHIMMMQEHAKNSKWNSANTDINSNNIDTGNNHNTENNNNLGKKKQKKKDPVDETIDKFKMAMSKINNVIWASYGKEQIGSFDDLCNYNDKDFILEQTGLLPSEWLFWKSAIADTQQIDRRIDLITESLYDL
jgi:hypothetical protein